MSKKLTEQQKKNYVQNPTECPHCHSEDISGENFEPETMTREIGCESCGENWLECLKIVDITEVSQMKSPFRSKFIKQYNQSKKMNKKKKP